MAENFATGFQQGFGLVSQVQDRAYQREQDKIAKQERDQARADRLSYQDRMLEKADREAIDRAQERSDTIKFRTEQEKRQRDEALFRDQQAQRRFDATMNSPANQNARLANAAALADQEAREAAVVASKLFDLDIGKVDFTDVEASDFAEGIRVLNNNPILELGGGLAPFNAETAAKATTGLRGFITGEDMSGKEAVLGAVDLTLNLNKRRLIGQEITKDMFQNAPAGLEGMKVIDMFAHDIRSVKDQNGNDQLFVDVAVTVENDEGKNITYIAPMTENADPSKTAAVAIPMKDAIKAFAGKMQYANALNQKRAIINRTLKQSLYRKDGRFDKRGYDKEFRDLEDRFNAELKDREDQPVSRGSTTTFADIAADPQRKKDYIEHLLLHGDPPNANRSNDFEIQLNQLRDVPQIDAINRALTKNEQPRLTPAELSELATYFSQDANGNFVASDSYRGAQKDYYRFLNRKGLITERQTNRMGGIGKLTLRENPNMKVR